jgi:hypothetical protein
MEKKKANYSIGFETEADNKKQKKIKIYINQISWETSDLRTLWSGRWL